MIKLDFLGKDSMRYENTVKVPAEVFRNLREFCRNKSKEEDIFDRVSVSLSLTQQIYSSFSVFSDFIHE